jgi:hypothetical protein
MHTVALPRPMLTPLGRPVSAPPWTMGTDDVRVTCLRSHGPYAVPSRRGEHRYSAMEPDPDGSLLFCLPDPTTAPRCHPSWLACRGTELCRYLQFTQPGDVVSSSTWPQGPTLRLEARGAVHGPNVRILNMAIVPGYGILAHVGSQLCTMTPPDVATALSNMSRARLCWMTAVARAVHARSGARRCAHPTAPASVPATLVGSAMLR